MMKKLIFPLWLNINEAMDAENEMRMTEGYSIKLISL